MTIQTNTARATRAGRALTEYGDDLDDSNLIDLLADTMHWCDENDEDFERCLRIAKDHHWVETHGEA